MDEELRQYLGAMEARLNERMDGKIDAVYQRIEQVETSLLTAFHQWASPVEARHRGQREMLAAIDLELEALKLRVDRLEGKQ